MKTKELLAILRTDPKALQLLKRIWCQHGVPVWRCPEDCAFEPDPDDELEDCDDDEDD